MTDKDESEEAKQDVVTISREDARTIRAAFLPTNPNKLRSACPEVVAAAKRFIAAVEARHDDKRAWKQDEN